jgi:hypothetical protein
MGDAGNEVMDNSSSMMMSHIRQEDSSKMLSESTNQREVVSNQINFYMVDKKDTENSTGNNTAVVLNNGRMVKQPEKSRNMILNDGK